ncbi:carcinoembryonic antigen-related cell adhesion molecule 6-like [Pristis pectinata]|uniref:carcinoembryonic antigen-related cell adhesion molecule 6-like n=1 Tax=Pristis pectinata TaxID=685728 RepID=UPI00223D5F0C|nr:carcinoembryonic antigen-related cell adhesion molecule 6-like [Pristis pectinata]
MEGLPLTALALCLFISTGQNFNIHTEHSRINATVGGDALFSVRPSAALKSGNWAFGGKTIATWIGRLTDFHNAYRSRAKLLPNGSLRLKSVQVTDSGVYRVTMIPLFGSQRTTTITLWVSERASEVTVSTNNSTPVENGDTIELTCHARGTVQTRTWLKNNQTIPENGRIFTSPGKATLTITSLNRNDSGTYKCVVNEDFNSPAGEIYVQVYYGPEKIRILPQAPFVAIPGSNLTLTCFALSFPRGDYAWYNGSNKLQTGQQYTIESVSSVDSGNYTCQVINSVTKRSSNLTVHVTTQDVSNTLNPGAIAGIVVRLLLGLFCGISVWLIARNTDRVKGPPQAKYDMSITSGGKSALAANAANALQTYENFPSDEQNVSSSAPDGNSIYMMTSLVTKMVVS